MVMRARALKKRIKSVNRYAVSSSFLTLTYGPAAVETKCNTCSTRSFNSARVSASYAPPTVSTATL